MNLTIARQSIRANWRGPTYTGLGLGFFVLIFAAVYDQMKADISTFLDVVPAGFEAFIGDMSNASSPEGWLSIELFALFVPLALAILGITLGSKLIGREEDTGTLELLLSRPVSRHRIVVEKALALGLILMIPTILIWLGALFGRYIFPFDVNLVRVIEACLSAWLFGLVFGLLTLATQAASGRRGIAVAIGSGALGLSWITNIVAQLVSSLQDLQYASPLYYYNSSATLIDGLDLSYAGVLLAAAVICYVVVHIGFSKRDITS